MSSLMFLSSFCLHSIILHVFLFFTSATIVIGSNVSDHDALLQFKAKITDDPLGVMSSWNHTTHFCQWPGVICSSRHHQRVTSLDLGSFKLSGSVSPHVGNLSFLKEMLLQNNSFTQEIPPQIGRLHRLQLLYLYNNSFIGRIPINISGCSKLSVISLGRNHLKGEIPIEFGSLIGLNVIAAHDNDLTGTIPLSFGNLTSLEAISLASNYLSGSIPHTLGQLRDVSIIALAENNLSGIIPPTILNFSSIAVFDVGDNQIQGSLPVDLGKRLPNLEFFSVGGNQFTGHFPISVSNASNLALVDLGQNNFFGRVPSLEKLLWLKRLLLSSNHLGSRGKEDDLSFLCSLTNTTTLEKLAININNFGGMLPQCIGNLSTKVDALLLDNNFILGSIPNGIENLKSLMRLEMCNNQLSGTIPSSIGRLEILAILILSGNKFSGNIPSTLGNLTQLLRLELSMNNVQGSIPSSLRNCQNLLVLDLSYNGLNGVIPPAIVNRSWLLISFNLSKNYLTGSLPMEIEQLKNIGGLDVSMNMLSGKIPTSLGSCTTLETLLMQGNHFQGTIPSSLSSLRALEVLDLSQNNFSGKIPEFFTGLVSLRSLNLSYNDFHGMLPTRGIFTNTMVVSIIGNNELCGGKPEFHLPICKEQSYKTRELTKQHKLIVVLICGVFGAALFLCFLLVLRFKKKRKKTTLHSLEESLFRVSYQDLLKATDGFSSVHLIGEGSFGYVYKGVLVQDGTVVAVKVLNLSHRGASKSFIAECEALRNIRHRNLVKILTACSSVDYHGNDFKALVYEFMVNGSLEDWLHPPVATNETNEVTRNLNFLQRLNISIDVACALEYLHQYCETPIVHCDLKPSNVLLDNDMVAHVGDFGLAKFLSIGALNCFTNQSSSIEVRGTIGYAPPEYGLGSEVSTRGDIYSFGILLLEIFTGKRPTDDNFKNGLNMRDYVSLALPNLVVEIIDPVLLQERVEMETHMRHICNHRSLRKDKVLPSMTPIFEIGISCSAEMSRERVDMSKVAAELCSIRDKLLQT